MPRKKERPLRVADLFCGAGGFSEGFSQAGFEIVYALDNWGPACETHLRNHPSTETVKGDILDIEPASLPKIDVLIGSPPCTEFSYAKKGGKGDISLGMRLVNRFLDFVVELRPRYWIMENVPRLLQTLPGYIEIPDAEGERKVQIPQRHILNSADHGTPQVRNRLISGRYPLPIPSHSESPMMRLVLPPTKRWRTMGETLGILPDPLSNGFEGKEIKDPNYPRLSLPRERLTDHFHDSTMSDEETRFNRKAKVDHSWYGRMSFPDPLDRPARTIMATQLGASRETIAIEARKDGKVVYRQPTVRECACLQGYPITYQFVGDSYGVKYKLVGNSVPVQLSYALANAILEVERIRPRSFPMIRTDTPLTEPLAKSMSRRRTGLRRLDSKRKFRDHVPGSKGRGYRVDIDNMGGLPHPHPLGGLHEVEWVARLYIGSGKSVMAIVPTRSQIDLMLKRSSSYGSTIARVSSIRTNVERIFKGNLPDATTMQGIHAEWTKVTGWTPMLVLERVSDAVGTIVSEPSRDFRVNVSKIVLKTTAKGIPFDTLVALAISSMVCELMNDDDAWVRAHMDEVFRFDPELYG